MDSTDGVRGSGFDWMDPAFGLLPAYYVQGHEAEAGHNASDHFNFTDALNNGYIQPQQPNAYVSAVPNIGFVYESAQYNNPVGPCFPQTTTASHYLNFTDTLNSSYFQPGQPNVYAAVPSQSEFLGAPTGYNVHPRSASSGTFSSYQPSAIPAPTVNAIVPPAPPAPTIPPPNSVPCTHSTCPKVFTRAGDMRRHAKKHDPHAERFFCVVVGCRIGARGFKRKDKLADHVRAKHGE